MPTFKEPSGENNRRIYRRTVKTFCSTHTKRAAVAECTKCRRKYCETCLHIRAGELFCRSCLRKEDQDRRILFLISRCCVFLAVCSFFGMFGGGAVSAACFMLLVMSAAAAFILHRKSVEGLPPAIDTDAGYAEYTDATAVHKTTYSGEEPFPGYDLRGNPLAEVTEIILYHNVIDSELEALQDVAVNDQIWIAHDTGSKKDAYAIYAENRHGYCIGWIPNIKRYRDLKQNIAETLADPLHGSITAYLTEKYIDDNMPRAHIMIARYYTP